MRARILFAAGLVAALAVACSNPSADPPVIDEDLESKLDLALNGAAAVEEPAEPVVAVASPIEAPRPPETAPQPQPMRRRPVAPQSPPTVQAEAPVVVAPEPEPELARTEQEAEEPTFTLSPWPRTTDVVPEGATSVPSDGRGEPEGRGSTDDDGYDGRRPGRGNGPVIIIRGGVGERDPCAIHLPGIGGVLGGIIFGGGSSRGGALGPAGVLINERVPRVGPGNNPVLPATGGRSSFPGRGPLFQRGSLR